MHVIPFQIDSGKDGARNTMPGAADGARQYGEGLGGEEIARKNRGAFNSLLSSDIKSSYVFRGDPLIPYLIIFL
jgi:hypothetical protein